MVAKYWKQALFLFAAARSPWAWSDNLVFIVSMYIHQILHTHYRALKETHQSSDDEEIPALGVWKWVVVPCEYCCEETFFAIPSGWFLIFTNRALSFSSLFDVILSVLAILASMFSVGNVRFNNEHATKSCPSNLFQLYYFRQQSILLHFLHWKYLSFHSCSFKFVVS